jgi:hypothetical protein
VTYLNDNDKRNQLDALLNTYNLYRMTDFPTRIYNDSSSAIDNIFIDINRLDYYQVLLLISGLSDNEQIIILNVLQNKTHEHQPYFGRNINKYTMAEFKNSLSYETWDPVFEGYYVNANSYLNTYLRILYSSFPLIKINKVMHQLFLENDGYKYLLTKKGTLHSKQQQ